VRMLMAMKMPENVRAEFQPVVSAYHKEPASML
jgi:hypothetical protein